MRSLVLPAAAVLVLFGAAACDGVIQTSDSGSDDGGSGGTGGSGGSGGSGGNAYVTVLDGAGARQGADLAIPATSAHALAQTPRGYAALVRRIPGGNSSEELWLVEVDAAGATLQSKRLLGGNNDTVVGNEWFDAFYRRARLVWTGTQLSAYYTLQRRWPDNIAHQGDQLTHHLLDGGTAGGGWSWGCSHSLDVRMAWNGTRLGPVCLSDCYPQKAVMFNHNSALISAEPSGNCAGGSNGRLGGVVAEASGFAVTWSTDAGSATHDVGFRRVANNGTAGPVTWIAATPATEDSPHLARFGAGFLAGWREGTARKLVRLDSAPALVGAPETVSASWGDADDFITLSGGDVAWVGAWGGTGELKHVRVRQCP